MRPLTLFFYEKLFPGTQLVNRLQDLGYRVKTVADPESLVAQAEQEKPMLVIADLGAKADQVCAAIARLKSSPATSHLPVLVTAPAHDSAAQATARQAGATLVVHDAVILAHLEQFLDQTLQLD